MNELKVYVQPVKKSMMGNTIVGTAYYLKSDADKVIEDLIEKNKRLARKDLIMASNAIKDVYKELRHQKYKRCLATADFCESQHDYYNTLGNGFWLVRGDIEKREEYRKKASDFWWKWHNRWLELAKKYKPNNEVNNG